MRLDAQKQRLNALWNHPDTQEAVRKGLAAQGLDPRCESCMQIPKDGICDCSHAEQQDPERFEAKRRILRVMNARIR